MQLLNTESNQWLPNINNSCYGDDPLDIFGRSILGARWRTGAGVLFGAAASLACTYPCRLRRAGATVSAISSVAYVQPSTGQRNTGIVTDEK